MASGRHCAPEDVLGQSFSAGWRVFIAHVRLRVTVIQLSTSGTINHSDITSAA